MPYHQFQTENGEPYGSFEVFHVPENDGAQPFAPGWYWWACFPGCTPDSEDPNGPFATEEDAMKDAQS